MGILTRRTSPSCTSALKRAGIATELQIDATGDHDFGIRRNEKLPSGWMQFCLNRLRNQGS